VRPFRRVRGKYTAGFEPVEVSVLADLVDQVRQLLAERSAQAPADPLVALTGMAVGPSEAPHDPALARLLPDFSKDDRELSAGLRSLREPDIIAAKDAAARAVLDSLPPGGGSVHLDEQQARSWIAALNDVRLALGVRLGISDDDQPPPDPDEDEAGAAMHATYRWLSLVQESLVDQMLG
jgi:hypothetical protein